MADRFHLDEILYAQDGVISRRQALDCGLTVGQVRTRLRRGEWVSVVRGVSDAHRSALAAAGLGDPGSGPIHIAVDCRAHIPNLERVVRNSMRSRSSPTWSASD
ncbi:hypothetical protein [Gordonia crocea]|uniref:Uncharacterized protein n=1 Tax=Gordonia crocea TaxID=589162 RepID=A0A7I9UYN7_9ACTN|nr:hypothetical protein [Gordonia crocea]GED98042.1 hypothetical protein nbrc107697_20810 [Gordonia crocea]